MTRHRRLLVSFTVGLLILLLTGCNLPQSTGGSTIPPDYQCSDTSESPPEPESTATPALGPGEPTYPARFRITTTSSETSIGLISGAHWYDVQILSQSENIELAAFEDNRILLSQSKERAYARESVWVEVAANLAYLDPADPITFEVRRKALGQTTVEVFRIEEAGPYKITTLVWGGWSEAEGNPEVYEVSPQPYLGSAPNEYVTIAQLNFWYFGEGMYGGFENEDGSRLTPFIPNYGETYWSDDPDWVYQQIEWAVEYGVDAFSIEWDGPEEESLGVPMEKAIDEVFLVSPNIHKVRWAIFYDFPLRTHYLEAQGLNMNQALNFNQQIAYDTFVSDFVHFATKYFNHPQYLTIDGRPVVYIWATHAFAGNFAGAMAEARQEVRELGYDVFIVGDEVCYVCLNRAKASLFDGTTTFTFLIPGVNQPGLKNVGQAAETTDTAFSWWRDKIAGLKVVGREDVVNFQPAWAPQYDESWNIEFTRPTVVLAESRDQVLQMAEVARKHTEPAGDEGLKLIWINTWNCWGESTTIEPTIIDGNPKYPGGNYGFDFLEIIRDVYGVETYYTSP